VHDLVKKAFAPIEIGSQVQGRLIFQGWSIQPERFRKETPLMGIRGIDSHYKRFVDSTSTEGSGVITPPYGEYPGLQQRFLN
jgi:hypothetical protein